MVTSLKDGMKKAHKVIIKQNETINNLHSKINSTNYRTDAIEQHGRKEAIRLRGVTDNLGHDAEQIIQDIATEIEEKTESIARDDPTKSAVHIGLNAERDIQRCHFMGKAKKQIICKFSSFKTRMKFLRNKKIINGAKTGKYKDVFITEDLTSMRARLIWYINDQFSGSFSSVHTMNGTIRMKKDPSDDKWIYVNNPDDLFAHLNNESDFDLEFFNKGLHQFQILPYIPVLDEFIVDDETP